MDVLGIQGSPRKKGNCDHLLTTFLGECERAGAKTQVIRPQDLDIRPCKELTVCEKKGICPIRDQMEEMGYAKVRQADVVVLASPVFFYGISAQAKVFIDRCQMFWGRRYKLRLKDPARFSRQGFLLSVGASAGKRLFDGVNLTAHYFFDAISAQDAGALTYKGIEAAGDILARPRLEREIREAVSGLLGPLKSCEKILFVSRNGAVRAVMAAAFAMEISGGKIRAKAAGMEGPAEADPGMIKTMADAGLDVKYMAVHRIKDIAGVWPGRTIFIGSAAGFERAAPFLPEETMFWEIAGPEAWESKALSALKGKIEARVTALLGRS